MRLNLIVLLLITLPLMVFQARAMNGSIAQVNARDSAGNIPLYRAASRGDYDALVRLLKAGALLEEKDANGCTALHLAVENARHGVLMLLIAHRANLNAFSGHETPLHAAVRCGNVNVLIVSLLIHAGANTRVMNNAGFTPLGEAKRLEEIGGSCRERPCIEFLRDHLTESDEPLSEIARKEGVHEALIIGLARARRGFWDGLLWNSY